MICEKDDGAARERTARSRDSVGSEEREGERERKN